MVKLYQSTAGTCLQCCTPATLGSLTFKPRSLEPDFILSTNHVAPSHFKRRSEKSKIIYRKSTLNGTSQQQQRQQQTVESNTVEESQTYNHQPVSPCFFLLVRSLVRVQHTLAHSFIHTSTRSSYFFLFRSIQKVVAFLKTEQNIKITNWKYCAKLSLACFCLFASKTAMEWKVENCRMCKEIPHVNASVCVWVRGNRQGNPLHIVGDLITRLKLFAAIFAQRVETRDNSRGKKFPGTYFCHSRSLFATWFGVTDKQNRISSLRSRSRWYSVTRW